MVSERLPCEDIREVHLHHRELGRRQRITQRDARMRKRTGIQDDEIDVAAGLLDPITNRQLEWGLGWHKKV